MEDTDEQNVLHQQSVGHQGRGDAGCQQHLRQGVVHVLPAAAHVQLLYLTTDGRHVGLAQPNKGREQPSYHADYMGTTFTIIIA